jgi:hypothetical protein
MRPLSVAELLSAWELGLEALPLQRALAILAAANPESPPSALARLSLGRRDTDLLQLREWAFGKQLAVLADCPSCKQTLEFTVSVAKLREASPLSGSAAIDTLPAPESVAELQDRDHRCYQVRLRPINSEDVAACTGLELAAAQRKLLACCVLEARCDGTLMKPEDLPEEVSQPVLERLAASDPAAERRIELSCPECHESWSEVFDIVSFFWTEIDACARRTLREVNILARAYGWQEGEILAMSPMRRQIYIAMAQA